LGYSLIINGYIDGDLVPDITIANGRNIVITVCHAHKLAKLAVIEPPVFVYSHLLCALVICGKILKIKLAPSAANHSAISRLNLVFNFHYFRLIAI